jgi:ABC-2 type transport system permease protein
MNGLLAKLLRDQRRALVGWGIGLALVALMYASVYPSIVASAEDLRSYIEKLPEAFQNLIGGQDYTSPGGYLRSEFFSMMGPILFLVFAIGAGSRALAGEEEARTLDLLLSTSFRRRDLVWSKAAAIATTSFALGAVSFVAIAAFGPLFALTVPLVDLAAACAMLVLLALSFAGMSFAVGAITGSRAMANGLAGAVAVVAFILNALGPSVAWLRPLRPASPMRWYMEPDPLATGLSAVSVLVLVAIAVAGFAAAWVGFERRDLRA